MRITVVSNHEPSGKPLSAMKKVCVVVTVVDLFAPRLVSQGAEGLPADAPPHEGGHLR